MREQSRTVIQSNFSAEGDVPSKFMETALVKECKDGTDSNLNWVEKHVGREEAHQEIMSRLWGYPLAQQGAEDIYAFYGDYLRFKESTKFSSSVFILRLQHVPPARRLGVHFGIVSLNDRLPDPLCGGRARLSPQPPSIMGIKVRLSPSWRITFGS